MNDALGGQFEVLSTNAGPAVLQHIKAGKLKPLAVGAPARLDSLPDVPTLAELKHPAANLSSLFGIFAPAQTPAAVVARLNAEVNKALAQADLCAPSWMRPTTCPPVAPLPTLPARLRRSQENNARIIRAARIQGD